MLFCGRKATYEEEEDSHSVFSRTAASSAVQKLHEQEGGVVHTPSGIAFRHLPPNSARFSYATEGVLFISAQLSSNAVSALRKVRVLIRL